MTIRSRTNTPEYDEEYERLFGANKKPKCGSWVQDSETGEFIEKSQFTRQDPDAPDIMKPIEEFTSPIDGRVISDRSKLRQHNAEHGVTNIQDYGDNGGEAWFSRKAKERQERLNCSSREQRAERRETIQRALHQHGIY